MESVPSVLEPLVLSEVESGEEEESLFEEEPCLISPNPASISLYGSRRPHSSMGGLATSLLEGLPCPPPLAPTRRPRQRTLSTNAAIRREIFPLDQTQFFCRQIFTTKTLFEKESTSVEHSRSQIHIVLVMS